MQKIYAFLVNFFVGRQETGNLNEIALIVVLAILIIALCISILLARKNHLYSRHGQKEDHIIHH
jgi:hypothetical protein